MTFITTQILTRIPRADWQGVLHLQFGVNEDKYKWSDEVQKSPYLTDSFLQRVQKYLICSRGKKKQKKKPNPPLTPLSQKPHTFLLSLLFCAPEMEETNSPKTTLASHNFTKTQLGPQWGYFTGHRSIPPQSVGTSAASLLDAVLPPHGPHWNSVRWYRRGRSLREPKHVSRWVKCVEPAWWLTAARVLARKRQYMQWNCGVLNFRCHHETPYWHNIGSKSTFPRFPFLCEQGEGILLHVVFRFCRRNIWAAQFLQPACCSCDSIKRSSSGETANQSHVHPS